MSILTKLTVAQIKENKKRTTLTALAIGLIVSLLTAIALFVSSAWVVMYDTITHNNGEWHFRTGIVKQTDIDSLKSANFVDKITHTYAVDTLKSEQFPQGKAVFMKEMSKEFYSFGHITNGNGVQSTTPQKRILVSNKYSNEIEIGKEVTFTNLRGETMPYIVHGYLATNEASNNIDYIVIDKDYDSDQKIAVGKVSTFNNYFDTFNKYSETTGVLFPVHNSQLLSMFLVTRNEFLNGLIKGVIPILVSLIALISVMVISSSFTLSLNERLKQLGALSSVGTTRIQLVKMMFSESLIIGSIGIVFGLLLGFLGTNIALHYFDQNAQVIFKMSGIVSQFKLVVYWPVVVAVVVLSALIIMLSALFPALKASRRSPIENIKQVPFKKLLQLKRRKQGSRRNLLSKVFKQPAYLAYRYKKHNSSRSKTVFFVLTISLLTFNVVSNLLIHATNSVTQIANGGISNNRYTKPDITLEISSYTSEENAGYKNQQLVDKVKMIDGVESVRYISNNNHFVTSQKELMAYLKQVNIARFGEQARDYGGEEMKSSIDVFSLDKQTEEEFLKAINVTQEQFKGKGIIVTANFLSNKQVNAIPTNSLKGETITVESTMYRSESRTDTKEYTFEIVANVDADVLPTGVGSEITLILPRETHEAVTLYPWFTIMLEVDENRIDDIHSQLKALHESNEFGRFYMNNIHEQLKVMRALLSMVQIIAYGFLGLISLICLTAFYNTISTGVRLRRREFAMLQSIGMTKKQLRTMLAVENLTAGVLSIIIASVGSYILTVLGNAQGAASVSEVMSKLNYPILPTVISSVTLLVILILFNLSTQRSALKRSLVEDIKNETL